MQFESLLRILLILSALFGALRGGIQMLRPVISFFLARILLPVIAMLFRTLSIPELLEVYVGKRLGDLCEIPFIKETIADTAVNLTDILAFMLALCVCNLLLMIVFHFLIPKRPAMKLINAVIGGLMGLFVTILLMSAGYRLVEVAAPFSDKAAAIKQQCDTSDGFRRLSNISEFIFGEIRIAISPEEEEKEENG